jgi:hypothetical protein
VLLLQLSLIRRLIGVQLVFIAAFGCCAAAPRQSAAAAAAAATSHQHCSAPIDSQAASVGPQLKVYDV